MSDNPNPVRVIVVEDNLDDRELLQRQLRKSDMQHYVRFFSDGREALDFLFNPAAVVRRELVALFLDLGLPSLSGLDLLRALRNEDDYRLLPVIVMTSSNDPKDLAECQRLHVSSYVNKPITLHSFSKAVANVFHLPPPDAGPPSSDI